MRLESAASAAASATQLAESGRRAFEEFDALLQAIEGVTVPFTAGHVLELLNEIHIVLANLESQCTLLREVHPEPAMREAAEAQLRAMVPHQTRLLQHRHLYDLLTGIEAASLDPVARRFVSMVRRDMRRAGVDLEGPQRDRVRALREDLEQLGQAFARNIRDDVRSIELMGTGGLDGLPADYVRAHPPGPDGKIRITTEAPDQIPFMAYAKDAEARRALLRAARTRAAPRNLEVLRELLAKRHEVAQLLGYASWADYQAEEMMLGSASAIRAFIDEASSAAERKVSRELELLLEQKRGDDPHADAIAEWELDYYLERAKDELLAFDAREARPYFGYRPVRQAILDLAGQLFGVTFAPVGVTGWHATVETFDVSVDGEPAGRISLDMHPRAGKQKAAMCPALRQGVGGRQLPHPVVVCNFPDPRDGPALLDHRQVVTFFHEFGHLVHAVVRRRVPWARLGSPVEWDFIEAPSQFLEGFLFDLEVLRGFARHHETGAPIPNELVAKLRAARDFGRGIWVQRQLFFAAVSLAYHERDPRDLDTTAVFFELARRYSPIVVDAESRFEASFAHLEGYGATYYTYVWSLSLSMDLQTPFVGVLLDRALLRRYRDLVLAPGGSKPAVELIGDFLGRAPSSSAFRHWLEA